MKKINIIIITVLCIAFSSLFSASAMEYQHKLEAKNMIFSWTIEQKNIHVMVSAKTTGWVGIGFNPEKAMKGSNIIIGFFSQKKNKFKIEDHYGHKNTGHQNDVKLGGTNDLLDASVQEENGITTMLFTMPLSSDDKWDTPVQASGNTRIMLAHGAGRDSLSNRHPYRTVYDIDLSTGESKKIK